ncbi:hypothetical protein QNM99_24710 [Pseudomonas sp. PCH446]
MSPMAFVERLVERKMYDLLCGSAIDETIVTYTLESGRYQHHLDALASGSCRSAQRRGSGWGLSVWYSTSTAPMACFSGAFARACEYPEPGRTGQHAGILLAPGSLFSNTGEYDQHIRFNVSHCNHPGFKRFLQAHIGLAASRLPIGHDA